MFGSWTGATLYSASLQSMEVNAAQSKYTVFLFGFGGLVQAGGSLSQVVIVLLTVIELPAGEHLCLVATNLRFLHCLLRCPFRFHFCFERCVLGRLQNIAGMWYWFLPQMEQSWGTTNTMFPT